MRTKPFQHQARELEEHWYKPGRALLWEMRTGKTKCIIDTACVLYLTGEIDGVIVVAPNGVHRNWTLKQLPMHHWSDVPYLAHAWRSSEKHNVSQARVLATVFFGGLKWLTLNMEALILPEAQKAIRAFRLSMRNKFLVVFDESHHYGKPGSRRTKLARGLSSFARYRRILTGTTIENSPMQAYSQFNLLREDALGYSTYEAFQNHFASFGIKRAKNRSYVEITEYRNMSELRDRLAEFSSVVLREQCEDLPPVQYDTRIIELSDEQREFFRIFKKKDIDKLIEMGFQEPPDAGALLIKLQQIEGGYVKTPSEIKFIGSDKFNVVAEEANGYACLVYCQYVHEVEAVAKSLGIKAAFIHGKAKDREGVLRDFERGNLQFIVAQSQTISEGYNISTADKIIWFSQTPNAITRAQANARASEVGGKSKQVIDLIVPKGTDDHFLELTTGKTALAEEVARSGLQAVLNRLDP